MENKFLECTYRLDDKVYNEGYLLINDDIIFGVFTLDYIIITHNGAEFQLELMQYDLGEDDFSEVLTFKYPSSYDFLEAPETYNFTSLSGKKLVLDIKRKISDPITLSEMKEIFEEFLN